MQCLGSRPSREKPYGTQQKCTPNKKQYSYTQRSSDTSHEHVVDYAGEGRVGDVASCSPSCRRREKMREF